MHQKIEKIKKNEASPLVIKKFINKGTNSKNSKFIQNSTD